MIVLGLGNFGQAGRIEICRHIAKPGIRIQTALAVNITNMAFFATGEVPIWWHTPTLRIIASLRTFD